MRNYTKKTGRKNHRRTRIRGGHNITFLPSPEAYSNIEQLLARYKTDPNTTYSEYVKPYPEGYKKIKEDNLKLLEYTTKKMLYIISYVAHFNKIFNEYQEEYGKINESSTNTTQPPKSQKTTSEMTEKIKKKNFLEQMKNTLYKVSTNLGKIESDDRLKNMFISSYDIKRLNLQIKDIIGNNSNNEKIKTLLQNIKDIYRNGNSTTSASGGGGGFLKWMREIPKRNREAKILKQEKELLESHTKYNTNIQAHIATYNEVIGSIGEKMNKIMESLFLIVYIINFIDYFTKQFETQDTNNENDLIIGIAIIENFKDVYIPYINNIQSKYEEIFIYINQKLYKYGILLEMNNLKNQTLVDTFKSDVDKKLEKDVKLFNPNTAADNEAAAAAHLNSAAAAHLNSAAATEEFWSASAPHNPAIQTPE